MRPNVWRLRALSDVAFYWAAAVGQGERVGDGGPVTADAPDEGVPAGQVVKVGRPHLRFAIIGGSVIAIQNACGCAWRSAVPGRHPRKSSQRPLVPRPQLTCPLAGHQWRVMTQQGLPGMLAARTNGSRLRGANLVQSRTYEITFIGQAGTTLRAAFDDCEVSVGPGTTTLRAELPDQGALQGLLQRITSLRLELVDVRVMAPPPAE